MKMYACFVAVLVSFSLTTEGIAQQQPKMSVKELTAEVKDFCGSLLSAGGSATVRVEGEIRAQLRGVLKRLLKTEVEGELEAKIESYVGVAQSSLAAEREGTRKCRQDVLKLLLDEQKNATSSLPSKIILACQSLSNVRTDLVSVSNELLQAMNRANPEEARKSIISSAETPSFDWLFGTFYLSEDRSILIKRENADFEEIKSVNLIQGAQVNDTLYKRTPFFRPYAYLVAFSDSMADGLTGPFARFTENAGGAYYVGLTGEFLVDMYLQLKLPNGQRVHIHTSSAVAKCSRA